MKKLSLITSIMIAALALVGCGKEKPVDKIATPAENTQKQLRIATESNFKPLSYLDNQGNVVGFEIDLMNALCEEMKAECTIHSYDWETLIPGLKTNKFDAIIAGMSITPERQTQVDFSEPYFNNKLVLVGKKGDSTTIDNVDGKVIATQQATISAEYLQKNHPKAIVKTYDKQDNAYLDLVAGRVDLMLSDIVPISDWLTTETAQDFEIKGNPIDNNDNLGIAVRKDDALKADFDAALASLKTNGKYAQLSSKYFGDSSGQ